MKFTLSLLAVFAAIFVVSCAPPPCDEFIYLTCVAKVGNDYNPKDPQIPENDFDMDKRCRAIKPALECMKDAVTRCPSKDMPEAFVQFVIQQNAMEDQLCIKGNALRDRILKHSVCLNKQLPEVEKKCGSAEKIHADFMPEKDCDAHFTFRKCYVDVTQKNCGDESVEVLKDAYAPMITLFDKLCKK